MVIHLIITIISFTCRMWAQYLDIPVVPLFPIEFLAIRWRQWKEITMIKHQQLKHVIHLFDEMWLVWDEPIENFLIIPNIHQKSTKDQLLPHIANNFHSKLSACVLNIKRNMRDTSQSNVEALLQFSIRKTDLFHDHESIFGIRRPTRKRVYDCQHLHQTNHHSFLSMSFTPFGELIHSLLLYKLRR